MKPIPVCVPLAALCTSAAARHYETCREQFINIMLRMQFLGPRNLSQHFLHFLAKNGPRNAQNSRHDRILLLLSETRPGIRPRTRWSQAPYCIEAGCMYGWCRPVTAAAIPTAVPSCGGASRSTCQRLEVAEMECVTLSDTV